MLQCLNYHPRDKFIYFDEEHHKYTTDKVKDMTSVTTFIKSFFTPFNADEVLNKLSRFGTLQKKYPNMTQGDVKAMWSNQGKQASERGTKLHKYIELFYNGISAPIDEDIKKEISMFKEWAIQMNRTPYRTEWCIYDEELKIAGMIDMICRADPRDPRKLAIYDWKCSKEIKYKNKYSRARDPISHLEDCNFNHYSLQLNLYKYILEKNYNVEIVDMHLVVIHSNNEQCQLIPVRNMKEEIISML